MYSVGVMNHWPHPLQRQVDISDITSAQLTSCHVGDELLGTQVSVSDCTLALMTSLLKRREAIASTFQVLRALRSNVIPMSSFETRATAPC